MNKTYCYTIFNKIVNNMFYISLSYILKDNFYMKYYINKSLVLQEKTLKINFIFFKVNKKILKKHKILVM